MQNSNQEIQSSMTQSKTSIIIDSLIFNTYKQSINDGKWHQILFLATCKLDVRRHDLQRLICWMNSWVSLTSFIRKWYAYHGFGFDQRNGATTSNTDDPPHPQWHHNQAASTITTQNLRLATTKTQIATYTSCSSKPRPKSVMLLLHNSKPKPI